MPDTPYADELRFARAFAEDAAARIRSLARASFQIDTKADGSPVTAADRDVNAGFIERVQARYSGDGVLGEEASLPAAGDRTWVIDPVDGTQQFILGIPVYMVAIALVLSGRPVVGVAHNPATGERYWATTGGGAYRDGRPIYVSTRDGRTTPARVAGTAGRPNQGGLSADALLRFRLAPQAGADPYRFTWPTVFSGCKVAEGSWDADLYPGDSAHDVAAVAVIVREAGGTATDRCGADQRYDGPVDGCILSNGVLHDELVRAWTRQRPPGTR